MPKDYSAEINYPEEDAMDFKEFETEEEMEQFVAEEEAKAEEAVNTEVAAEVPADTIAE